MKPIGTLPRYGKALPKNRLIDLLNLNLDNENEIEKYCDDYNLFVLPINSTYSAEIKKILSPIKTIIDYYKQNTDLLPEHVYKINDHLEGITYRLSKIYPEEIKKINGLLDPSPESFNYEVGKVNTPQFAFFATHKDSISSLWQEFAKYVVRKQRLDNCAGCGRYFIPKKKSHGQRYCSTLCQDRYKKKRSYYKKQK